MGEPLAYFLTFTTYGTWLHGRPEGSVDRQHNLPGEPLLPANAKMERARRMAMRQEPYFLDEARRAVVLRTICEVAAHRRWRLWAAHVRTNHVHVVVTAREEPEKVMADFKAWASRRLREDFVEAADRDRWTQHGSTIYLNSWAALESKVTYVIDEQGEMMAHYDNRIDETKHNEPEA
ncbi:MAG TPA: transposase [Gemmataceae bacterium]|nr:transposase [Gemmataceae bacterium]